MAKFCSLEQTGHVVDSKHEVADAGVHDTGASLPSPPETASSGLLWGVGAVSAQLDIARPTLRTWDRRYGLGPSLRTAGGHRRYTETDVARVQLMNKLLDSGVAAAQAAHIARTTDEAELGDEPTTPARAQRPAGQRRATSTVSALVRASQVLQADELARGFSVQLQRRGAVEAWEQVFVPFLVEVGQLWEAGELGVESEHLASGVLASELRAFSMLHRNRRPVPARVLLACAEDEQHSLPVLALEASLAERKVPSLVLGQRVPAVALRRAIAAREPAVVFVWASMRQTGGDLPWAGSTPSSTRFLLGGPGWDHVSLHTDDPALKVERVHDIDGALGRIERTLG
jgi:DNA-binding transcriptional MerR regulator